MSNKCRNKVVIEVSVEELMELRVRVGQLTPMITDIRFIIKMCNKLLNVKRLTENEVDEIRTILFEVNFPHDLEELEDSLPLLNSLFSYSDDD